MRKIFVVMAALLMLVQAGEAADRFVAFPTVGVCTGDSVRYRSSPNTDADIWGRLNTGERVIVDSQTAVDGEIWYEILPKDAQDSAFVFGKYLVPYYSEETQQSPVGKMIVDILQTYSPNKDNDYYSEYGGEEVSRKYGRDGWLNKVEAWKPGCSFGEITIGDSVSKITVTLGDPDTQTDTELHYTAGSSASLTFRIKDGKITRMIYEE